MAGVVIVGRAEYRAGAASRRFTSILRKVPGELTPAENNAYGDKGCVSPSESGCTQPGHAIGWGSEAGERASRRGWAGPRSAGTSCDAQGCRCRASDADERVRSSADPFIPN